MATLNFRDITAPRTFAPDGSSALGASDKIVTNLRDVGAVQSTQYGGALVTSATTTTTSARYKLRGWNTSLQSFEVWTSTDPYSSPPSLASLQDITFTEFDT